MKLHQEIKGRNTYCGPAVIAYLTGVSTDEAATAIRHHSRQRSVRGAFTHHVIKALRDFGIFPTRSEQYEGGRRPTLAGWLKSTVNRRVGGRVFLVVAGNHFQIVTGHRYACGRIREIVSVRDERVKRRARVEEVYELSGSVRLPEYPHPCSKKSKDIKAKERLSVNSARAKAKRLAAEHGIIIDIDEISDDSRHYWVYATYEIEAHQDYPFEGDHICIDWLEVEYRVKEIIEFEKSLAESDPLVVS